jgi:two-component system, NarL family, sensor kinase
MEIAIFLIVSSFVILLLVGFIIGILFLYQRRQNRFQKELDLTKSNYEKETFKAQLEMQEETFQYISQEIHDNVGQFLSLAKLHLNTLNLDQRDSAIEKLNYSADLLTRALDDLRDLSKSLSSDLIRTGGFAKAIEQQVGQLQKIGRFHVLLDIRGEYHYLSEQKEIILFRILQEALNNIIRHSGASEILVFISSINNSVNMRIQDNGRGFDDSFLRKPKINIIGGINIMQKRAKLINADFEIESQPGHGTKITVTTPISG